MRLKGNTIFITGGGSGIGRGFAEALHKLGNKVIIGGRRRGHLDAVVAANSGMATIELDIADPASIERAAKTLLAEHPDLNMLINNAGIMQLDQAAGRIDDALMLATINTNLIGAIRMTSSLIEHLKTKDGAVVLIQVQYLASCRWRSLRSIRRPKQPCIPTRYRSDSCSATPASEC
jgi:uncharacterized oxidoreductase